MKYIISLFLLCNLHAYEMPHYKGVSHFSVESSNAIIKGWHYKGIKSTILLLHGGPGVPDYLHPVAKFFHDAGYSVITFNQRGTATSSVVDNNFSIDAYNNDITSVLNHFKVDKVDLYGHSWGGLLAQSFFISNPNRVSSLILSNSSIGFGSEWKEMESEVMEYNRKKGGFWSFSLMGLNSLAMRIPFVENAAMRGLICQVDKNYYINQNDIKPADKNWLSGVSAEAMLQTREMIISKQPIQSFKNIPTLIVYGKYDIYGDSYKKLLAKFKDAKVVLMQKSGHRPWLDEKENYEKTLLNFLGEDNEKKISISTVNLAANNGN